MSGRKSLVTGAGWLVALGIIAGVPALADAQARGGHRAPPRPPGHVAVRGHVVFVGGYFYDPHFGPYPWWGPGVYPHAYFPLDGLRAQVRIVDAPEEAAVYVDGFYAGVVDDFDGIFQSLPLPPGGHEITLYYEGYRTVRQGIYLSPGSTYKLHQRMERLPAGTATEPPPIAPPVPPPPVNSYLSSRTPPHDPAGPLVPGAVSLTSGYGALSLCVQPASAEVTIDGERWASSVEGQFVLQLAAGSHRVEVGQAGFQRFAVDVQVRQGETVPLNVMLSADAK